MAHAIKELCKLTCRAKNIDGTPINRATGPANNLEVAGILGMRNATTGKKLSRQAYSFARYVFCGDISARFYVKAGLLHVLQQQDVGKINEYKLMSMAYAALNEFIKPTTKMTKDGQLTVESYTKSHVAKTLDIKRQSITNRHMALHSILVNQMNIWASEVIEHIHSHNRDHV